MKRFFHVFVLMAIPVVSMVAQEVPFRVNLFETDKVVKGVRIATFTEGVAMAEKHIAIANIYLNQIGVKLVPDPDKKTYNIDPKIVTEATLINPDKPGFFRIKVKDTSLVSNIDPSADNLKKIISINDHANVIQLSYVQSVAPSIAQINGILAGRPHNENGGSVTLKFRIAVDEDSSEHTMQLIPPAAFFDPTVWGDLITNNNGDPVEHVQSYGQTIAHEVGHILSLKHRAPDGDPNAPDADGLAKPKIGNLMGRPIRQKVSDNPLRFSYPGTDLDLIQLNGARGSDALQ